MRPGRFKHASFKANEDEVAVGDLVFVPEGDEIFKGLTNAPPRELKDHLALIIELFAGKAVDNSYVWLLQISSVKSGHFNKRNPLHVEIYDARNPRCKAIEETPDHEEVNCKPQCQQFLYLMLNGQMRKESYVIAGRVHELPLRCLQRLDDFRVSLRPCSLKLIREMASNAISETLKRSQLYRSPLMETLRLEVDYGEVIREGRFCLLAPRSFKLGGIPNLYEFERLCVYVGDTSRKPDMSHVCIIISKVEAQNRKIEWGNSTSGPFRALLPFKGRTSPFMPASSMTDLSPEDENNHEVSFANGDGISDSFLIVFPSFLVRTDELLAVPDCVSRGHAILSKESLDTVKRLYTKVLARKTSCQKNRNHDHFDHSIASKTGDTDNTVKSTLKDCGSKVDCQAQLAQDAGSDAVANLRMDGVYGTDSIQTSDIHICRAEESHYSICVTL